MTAKKGTFSLASHSMEDMTAPMTIQVGYKINGVGEINMSQCIFEIDIKVFLFWTDPKAIGQKEKVLINLEQNNLFNPEIVVSNDHHLTIVSAEPRVTNSKTGDIKCTIHYRGTAFIRDMELNLFPFDCQNLQICLKSKTLGVDRVLFVPKPDECALEHHVVHEWNIIDHKVESLFAYSLDKTEHSTCFISILAQRQSGWFVNNVFIVSSMLLFFAWSSFLNTPDERGGKVDIIVCAVIASIANKFVVGDELPKVPYRTLVDLYVDLCFFLIMVSMGSLFIVFYVYAEYFPAEGHHSDDAHSSTDDHAVHDDHYYAADDHHTDDHYTDDHHTVDDHAVADDHHFATEGWKAALSSMHRSLNGLESSVEPSSPTAEVYSWRWNWFLFGISFGIFLLFNIWLLAQLYSVKKDIKLWKNFDPHDSSNGRRRGWLLRESHFLYVAGTHHHHLQQTNLRPAYDPAQSPVIVSNSVQQLLNSTKPIALQKDIGDPIKPELYEGDSNPIHRTGNSKSNRYLMIADTGDANNNVNSVEELAAQGVQSFSPTEDDARK